MNAAGDDQGEGLLAGKLLGEIELKLPYRTMPGVTLPTGDMVYLRRRGTSELHIETRQRRSLGRVPRSICRWLMPLVDRRIIWLEAYVKQLVLPTAQQRQHLVVLASVYLHRSRLDLLAPKEASNPQQTLHQLVLATYQQLPRCRHASEVRTLHASLLRKIGDQDALDETHLLLALFPRVADELDVARRMMVLGDLSEYLASIEMGTPLQSGPLTAFPLVASHSPDKEYWLFQHDDVKTAIVEQDDMTLVEVINERPGPLLALPGELFCSERVSHALATATLVPPRGAHQFPVAQLELEEPCDQKPAGETVPLLRGRALAVLISLGKAAGDEHEHAARRARVSRYVAQLCESLQTRRSAIARLQQELQLPPDAVGAVLMRGEQLVGLELCATPTMLQALWPRVILSYAAELHAEKEPSQAASQDAARYWMSEAGDYLRAAATQTGWGDSFVLHHETLAGTALVYRSQLCHLTAFRIPAERNEVGPQK